MTKREMVHPYAQRQVENAIWAALDQLNSSDLIAVEMNTVIADRIASFATHICQEQSAKRPGQAAILPHGAAGN